LLTLALVKKSAVVVGGRNKNAQPASSRTVARNFMRHITIIITFFLLTLNIQGQRMYLDSTFYANGQLESKGIYCEIDSQRWQCGFWEYWYEDGKKYLEEWADSVKTLYINMWLPDGRQIVKSGNGFHYYIERQSELKDSLVYEIKDGTRSGSIKRFRSYANNLYFLVETGYYENNKETGVWNFRDTVLKTTLLRTYKNGRQNGLEASYFSGGQLKDSVNYYDNEKKGNYRAYSEQGILLKDYNYNGGRLTSYFKEYHPNGNIKIEGNYTQAKGYIKVRMISRGRGNSKKTSKIIDHLIDNKPLKQGLWKFYDEDGRQIKTENYLNNKKI
jgi:antitoxin component YwqK of YwqJK toxin-antitoxin module